MDIGKDEITVGATIIGFLGMIFGGGRAYEKLSGRVTHLEEQPPCVSIGECGDRRAGCNRENKLQFDAGEKHFDRLEKSLVKIEETITGNHREVMDLIISEMKK